MYDPARDKWNASEAESAPVDRQRSTGRPRSGSGRGNRGSGLGGQGRGPNSIPIPHYPTGPRNGGSAAKRRRESQNRGSAPEFSADNSPASKRSMTAGSNNDSHVRHHYNTRQSRTISDRKRSQILDLRQFNNFVKALLIDRFTRPHDIAFDMACGKGGDLQKWSKACIDGLIGVDIADVSISDARQRYENMGNSRTFWADFCVGNCFQDRIEDIVDPNAFPVNTVSCQFALHYAWDSESRARAALSNVSRALKPGGTFIGTIPNSEVLAENLRGGRTEWGNGVYRVRFDQPHPDGKFEKPYGNRYSYFLSEAVEDVPEFVVPLEQFIKLAREFGLVLELAQPFQEFFYSQLRDTDVLDVARKQRLVDFEGTIKIDPEQLEACSMYLAFVFVKKA